MYIFLKVSLRFGAKFVRIVYKEVKEFNHQISPKGLQQVIENLKDKQKEALKEIDFGGFLHLQADIIPGKLALWLVHNFDTRSCSLALVHGRLRVTEQDVHMTLGLPKGPVEATTLVMATLKPGEELEMKVINMCTLNDLERKRDVATPSGLFTLCDQSVGTITLYIGDTLHMAVLPTNV
ncbi:hypothetical protein Cgig2_024772 [Carnegiea gigantea]|uniref:Uncharacterized protein n=1 Tax=Carnegiea gigantea TaxID=171969 RepID=A0A9Q1GRC7_9CARY|nr:hypothetical protein Cgig2_024772 [Carnegiea gigantea]